jgi:hypothetical protein
VVSATAPLTVRRIAADVPAPAGMLAVDA